MINADSRHRLRFVRAADVDSTLAADRAVIYHRESKAAITLNPAGTVIWEALIEPRSGVELGVALQEKWPALSEEDAARDVELFLQELLLHGFCNVVE